MNSPNPRRGKDDGRGALGAQEIPNGRLIGEIQLAVGAHQEIAVPPALERPEDRRPHEAAVPGHIDLRRWIQCHWPLLVGFVNLIAVIGHRCVPFGGIEVRIDHLGD